MTDRTFRSRRWWIALTAIGALLLTPVAASAAPAQVERQGSRVLGELESGKLQCGEASADDFERVGEYVMGRMLGSGGDHEAMDEMMSRMMGAGSEARVHEAMGRRFAGCGGGQLPTGFGRMMGAVNAMGMMGGGMMGGFAQGERFRGPPGSMMGGYRSESSADDDDFDGPSAAAMIAMMAVLIGGVAVAVLWIARRRPSGPLRSQAGGDQGGRSAIEVLDHRLASGEISPEEYRQRRETLRGVPGGAESGSE